MGVLHHGMSHSISISWLHNTTFDRDDPADGDNDSVKDDDAVGFGDAARTQKWRQCQWRCRQQMTTLRRSHRWWAYITWD